MVSDQKKKLIVSSDGTRKDSISLIIYPPMTLRILLATTLPYRVENWTFDAETDPSKTWVLQTTLRHVEYPDILSTLGRWMLEGEASLN